MCHPPLPPGCALAMWQQHASPALQRWSQCASGLGTVRLRAAGPYVHLGAAGHARVRARRCTHAACMRCTKAPYKPLGSTRRKGKRRRRAAPGPKEHYQVKPNHVSSSAALSAGSTLTHTRRRCGPLGDHRLVCLWRVADSVCHSVCLSEKAPPPPQKVRSRDVTHSTHSMHAQSGADGGRAGGE